MREFRQMTPTENWLWALAEARQDNEREVARTVASRALDVWRDFTRARRRMRIEGRA